MASITESLKNAAEMLEKSGINEARREAKSLLVFALNTNQTFLVAHWEYELSSAENAKFQTLVARRAKREPFQYITGRQEFCGLDFIVTPDVLIPRPETELLVETAIKILQNIENPRFCEIGVGSGCLSISILHKLKNASAIGADVSKNALEITQINAEIHRVASRFELRISDVFDALLPQKFDLIVSNPPYISPAEMSDLQPEVRDFEPQTALTDGKNGFSIIEKIINDAPDFLKPGGFLLLEIGYTQSVEVAAMFDIEIWSNVEVLPDFQRIPRVVRARLIV